MRRRRDRGGQVRANQDESPRPGAVVHDGPVDGASRVATRERHPVRAFFARNRGLDLTYRVLVGAVGAAIVILGAALVPLPGPGWLIVFAGLALLATEFTWAQRLLDFAKSKVRGWTEWMTRQSLVVRLVVGLAGLALVAGLGWAYVEARGVPGWIPAIG